MIYKACMCVAAAQTAYKLLIGWKPNRMLWMDRMLRDLYIQPIREQLSRRPSPLVLLEQDKEDSFVLAR